MGLCAGTAATVSSGGHRQLEEHSQGDRQLTSLLGGYRSHSTGSSRLPHHSFWSWLIFTGFNSTSVPVPHNPQFLGLFERISEIHHPLTAEISPRHRFKVPASGFVALFPLFVNLPQVKTYQHPSGTIPLRILYVKVTGHSSFFHSSMNTDSSCIDKTTCSSQVNFLWTVFNVTILFFRPGDQNCAQYLAVASATTCTTVTKPSYP